MKVEIAIGNGIGIGIAMAAEVHLGLGRHIVREGKVDRRVIIVMAVEMVMVPGMVMDVEIVGIEEKEVPVMATDGEEEANVEENVVVVGVEIHSVLAPWMLLQSTVLPDNRYSYTVTTSSC